MTIKTDKAGNEYIEIGHVRVTFVRAERRPRSKNWAGQDVLRIQARSPGGKLRPGPEIPAAEASAVLELVRAVTSLAPG